MEQNPNAELINQMESLNRRIHELETENANLSAHLSKCVCHNKITESDRTRVLDCTRLIEKMEVHKLDENMKNRSNDKVSDERSDTMALGHLPRRHIALKVVFWSERHRWIPLSRRLFMKPDTWDILMGGGEIRTQYYLALSEIFKALRRTMLISGDKKELQYSRCGRTDKGVSSVGQVISLFLRSNFKKTSEINGSSGESIAEESCGREIDYVKLLNRVLPQDIRIIGWSPAPTDFTARFSCLSREYKYFFWKEKLNTMVMEIAGKKFIGEHDFRNFCKMDAANVHNYRRLITSFEIFPCNERFEDEELWAVKIKGSAFLWHQIRCMVAVLFLIGQGLESPNVIDDLLDVERTPRKPQYTMAPEIPLVLQSCEFEGLKFKCSSDARQALRTHLEKECRSYRLQAAIFDEALLTSSGAIYENIQLNSRTRKESVHIPLMSRPTEPTYEERRAKLNAGGGKNKVHVVAT